MSKFIRGTSSLLLALPLSLFSQTNVPTGATGPASATAKSLPVVYLAAPVDYLRTFSPNKPIQDTSLVNMSALVEDVSISTQYIDCYGRTVQTIDRQSSPGKNDRVAPAYFDEFGRPNLAYLPFTAQTGNSNDGKMKLNAFVQDSAFFKSLNPTEQINYSEQLYDGSPYNIPVKSMAPGNSWGGAGVGVSYSHRINTLNDSVRLWTIAITDEDDLATTSAIYQAGALTVQQITDEKGVQSLKYTDMLGRTVLTRTQLAASPGTGHVGWLCTYYVYDEMNHVRMVIPPKAVEALNNPTCNWSLASDTTINKNLCYAYYYDSRGRVTMKRIPGKGKIFAAYDLFDRAVMSQDARLRATNQWSFVLYDAQSRPVKSGLITTSLLKDSVLTQAARSAAYPALTGTFTVTGETYYDDYNWIASTGAPLSSSLVTTDINSTNFNTNYNTSPDYAQPITTSNRIRGSVTGIKKIILNSSNYLFQVTLYDDHGRSIQSKQTNYTGGTDVATLQYGFTGRPLRSHLQHQKSGNNAQTHTLLTKYSYDHAGRVKTITKNLDGLGDKVISQATYNEAGQLITKVIGASTSETQNYAYNIRGWLTSINQNYVTTTGSTSNYFGEALSYDFGFANNQLNGSVAGVCWKAGGDGIARAYGFTYDNTNRLTLADFSQQNQGSSSWTNTTVDYTVSGLGYDAAGNIQTLKQRGLKVGSSATIDSLTYQYFPNSNQLQKVSDGITDNSPLGDFKDTTSASDDYTYDINGNISKDNNRHMHTAANGPGAVYNFLDKPDSIVINGRAGIHYFYDAGGNQLAKQVNDYTGASPSVKTTLYLSGFVYLNDTLQYILQEEGRIRYAQKKNSLTGALYYAYEYEYFIKDHMGNVRTVLTEGRDTATYAATMESRDSVVVAALFSNVYTPVNTVFAKPMAFDTDTSNHFVARLNASSGINHKTGPSLVLKVMAGDQLQISTFAYYNSPVQPPAGATNLLSDLLTLLAGGVVNNSVGKLGAADVTNVSNALNPNVVQFLNNGRSYDSTRPKAYLNWILFDNQFNYVASNSGVQQVQAGSSKQALAAPLQTIGKNGYLYVYVSNESPQDVYFDNLTVKHFTGPLAQEQSYYPFGLPMAGISDKALLKPVSPYKGNGGTEYEEDYGLNYYNTTYRKYDPLIGRFTGVDALAEQALESSPFHFGSNNPISNTDPSGLLDIQAYNEAIDAINDMISGGSGGGGGGGGAYGFSVHDNGNGASSWNNFTSAVDAFASAAGDMYANGAWGSGGSAAAGFRAAQANYNGEDADMIRSLSVPVVAIGKYGQDGNWQTTNGDDLQRQLHGNGALGSEIGWDAKANNLIGSFGVGWGAKENLLDFAAKASPEIEELGYFKAVKIGSRGLLAAQVVVSGAQALNAWSHSDRNWRTNDGNKWGVTAKSGLDIAMAAVATFGGPIGWAVAGSYFLLDATGGLTYLTGHWSEPK